MFLRRFATSTSILFTLIGTVGIRQPSLFYPTNMKEVIVSKGPKCRIIGASLPLPGDSRSFRSLFYPLQNVPCVVDTPEICLMAQRLPRGKNTNLELYYRPDHHQSGRVGLKPKGLEACPSGVGNSTRVTISPALCILLGYNLLNSSQVIES